MALFVKFIVIGQIALRHHARYFAVLERGGAVKKPAAHAHGKPDYNKRTYIRALGDKSAERRFRAFNKPVLREEV